jgi:hypothetical protein
MPDERRDIQRDLRLFYLREPFRERVVTAAILSDNRCRDALPNLRFRFRVFEQTAVRVAVNVHKSRRDYFSARVYRRFRRAEVRPNGVNPAVLDANVGAARFRAGSVRDKTAANEEALRFFQPVSF